MANLEILPRLESQLGYITPTSTLSAVLILLGALLAGYLYVFSEGKGPDISHIPLLGSELSTQDRHDAYSKTAKKFLERGYYEYNKQGKPFVIETSEGPKIILGLEQLEEVKSLGDDVVDQATPVGKSMAAHYTGIGSPDDVVVSVIKTNLSTQLGHLANVLAKQVDKSLELEFPPCEDWTNVRVYERFLRVIAAVSTRIFIGEELTENEEWLQTTIGYTLNVFESANRINAVPPWKRPFVYKSFPSYKRMMDNEEAAVRLIKPVIQARREAMKQPGYVKRQDMTQWMLDARVKKAYKQDDFVYLAKAQLQLSVAAIHTSSMALTNEIYDLVANPKYINIILNEVKDALAQTGGQWHGSLMHGLQKTDSIMKESQRHEPVGFTITDRLMLQDYTLKDGTFLPKGSQVTGNMYQITHDKDILQSDTDPNVFDGLRYYNMREKLIKTDSNSKEVAGKHQFVSISQSSLMFGYGKHACPGRFFAGNELKLILVKFLLKYDIMLKEPTRFPSFNWEVTNTIDASREIMMKARK